VKIFARSLAAATALAVALAAAPSRAEDRNGYVVVKGGGYFPTASNAISVASNPQTWSLNTAGDVEAAVGASFGMLGFYVSGGYLWTNSNTSGTNVQVTGLPFSGVLQLRIPILFVVPYLEAGVGLLVNTAKAPSVSSTKTSFMVPAGGGVDFLLGPILLGAEARYLYVSPTTYDFGSSFSSNTATLRMSGVVVTANLGYRF